MKRAICIAWTCMIAGTPSTQGLADPGAEFSVPFGPAAFFALQRGPSRIEVGCGPGQTLSACIEDARPLLAQFPGPPNGQQFPQLGGPQFPGAAGGPPSGTGAPASRPTSVNAASEVQPTIWLRPSTTVDPVRLPLGNGRMVTDGPRKGYVFACDPFMYSMPTIIGARQTGPWVNEAGGSYDVTRKIFDRGRVEWRGRFSAVAAGNSRLITSNGLPLLGVPTGMFPVAQDDPAFTFDRNPNPILEQAIRFSVPLHPAFGAAPRCVYKEVGITLDGVPLHTGLDSSGRDENAYELNDTCNGKPQPGGGYHRHAMSECTPHIGDRLTVVGYALDGFPITGPYDADGIELTTERLDECHGTVSDIVWDGRTVHSYHYVLTRDFPYSVGCFRGTPTRNAFPPLPGAPPQLR